MEKDDLKDIFSAYNPPPAQSTLRFMSRLNERLDTVELIKERNTSCRRRSRLAVAVAGIAGVAVGSLLTLAMPWLSEQLVRAISSLPDMHVHLPVQESAAVAAWALIGIAGVLTSLGTYDLVASSLRSSGD